MLRIPGWSFDNRLSVNGKPAKTTRRKGYARIEREWRDGDEAELLAPMIAHLVTAHPNVIENAGRAAIQRGPLVYCLEQCDNAVDVRAAAFDRTEPIFEEKRDDSLLGGFLALETAGLCASSAGRRGKLYRPAYETRRRRVKLRAVPYCLWANREPGPMTVWLPRAL